MIRLQRMQMKEGKPNPSTHLTLETLAEAAVSLQPPESSQDVVNLPNIEPLVEGAVSLQPPEASQDVVNLHNIEPAEEES